MQTFQILTDSACDLTQEQLDRLQIQRVNLEVNIPGSDQHLVGDGDEEMKAFYARLRNQENVTTNAVNVGQMRDAMEAILAAGDDLLYIGFDSALSSTYQNGVIAAGELREKYPQRRIETVDTLCASLGFGLLVTLTAEKRLEGWDLEQTKGFAEENAPKMCHWFTVNDLFFLKRGGRVSSATAVVGTLLNIKPILHCDAEGHLTPAGKARGRKAALQTLVDKMKQGAIEPASQHVMICHGDCMDDAQWLKQQLLEQVGVKKVTIGYIGPVIASHAGPDTISVFYLGNNR